MCSLGGSSSSCHILATYDLLLVVLVGVGGGAPASGAREGAVNDGRDVRLRRREPRSHVLLKGLRSEEE